MYKIRVNDSFSFEVDLKSNVPEVNGQEFKADLQEISGNQFHLIYNHKSIKVEILSMDDSRKLCTIRVNGNEYTTELSDQFDELLHKLGMDNLNTHKVAELKAPMPGLVLKVLVNEGEEVKKGASLLVLEAMKMENIIKSPADLIIKSVKVTPGDKVEKNAVMLTFE